ncbi:hypothetical protein [Salmon gill poxvirus]|uniref:Uncharacterized protein n=1 Tax=Salmon gill poxvirus TaxID=1680908 RepID=A0A0H4Y0Y7_9POXV|nr:hypothetical protein AL387_gp041 [Salmon gill poxvirus]AKR04165.1 hypothetical protein SGPV041 [Salmon gill poxvirus]
MDYLRNTLLSCGSTETIELTGGKNFELCKDEVFGNDQESNIKELLDHCWKTYKHQLDITDLVEKNSFQFSGYHPDTVHYVQFWFYDAFLRYMWDIFKSEKEVLGRHPWSKCGKVHPGVLKNSFM